MRFRHTVEAPNIPAIFLSYRRADTSGYAGRLDAALAHRFGAENVFQDIEAIAPGSDFVEAIDSAVARCQVLLVLIGNTWLEEVDAAGARRLDDRRDFVRAEITTALRRGTPILPVLVEGTRMPLASELPEDLAPLARFQAIELSDTRWDYDFDRLARAIGKLTGTGPSRRVLIGSLAAAGVVAALVTALTLYPGRAPDVSGRWLLPNGSWWVVIQDGRRLEIEEVHHGSRAVWLRGSGRIESNRVEVELDAVFDNGKSRGHVDIAPDGKTLRGELLMLPRKIRRPLLLVRPD